MKIPITFEHEGKVYKGIFSLVSGGGSTTLFHLYVKGRYFGQMFKTDEGWRFTSQTRQFEELSRQFGECVQEYIARTSNDD